MEKLKSLLFYEHQELPIKIGYSGKDDIVQDLNLRVIFQAACRPAWKEGDSLKQPEKEDFYILDTMKRIMLLPLETASQVIYRQRILREALMRPDLMRAMYAVGQDAGKVLGRNRERGKERRGNSGVGSGEALGTFEILVGLLDCLERLKELLAQESFEEKSGLSDLKARIEEAYGEERRTGMAGILSDLEFFTGGGSVVFSMGLGAGMKQDMVCLKKVRQLDGKEKADDLVDKNKKWYQKLFTSSVIQLREEEEFQEAKQLEETAFSYVLSWFEPFFQELCEFFEAFQMQTAFYLGCVQLWERAASFGADFCFPDVIEDPKEEGFDFEGLYELSLAILTRRVPVSNAVTERDCRLMVVTGANQGGKSTYLRSIGIAQVMLQCGMFVPAKRYRGRLHTSLYTHFTRREDAAMNSGRLDEELKRMNGILQTVTKDSLLLLNESFATTTEKEGSLIAADLIMALYESGITVAMVTHLLQFAREMYAKELKHALFLSAERREDGTRTYHIVRRAPESTSFGLDLYDEIICGGKKV